MQFLNPAVTPLDACYGMIISLVTVFVASTLSKTKHSPFFNKPFREVRFAQDLFFCNKKL
jgi:hypothetical protein